MIQDNSLGIIKDSIINRYVEIYSLYEDANTRENDLLASISGVWIDEINNLVVVDIVDLTEKKKNVFVELFDDYEEVVFREIYSMPQESQTIKPGQRICVITSREGTSISYAQLSIGYRAYWDTTSGKKYGFTTCAHGIKESIDGNVYDSSLDNILGTIGTWQYSGSCDAAFIEIASPYSMSMTTMYSDSNGNTSNADVIAESTIVSSLSVGQTVYKVGATTFKTSAVVQSTDYTWTIDGVKFTNLTRTSDFCNGGDSGGLVYIYYNEKYWPAGLIKGELDGVWTAFTKAYELMNDMDVTPY